MANLGARLGSDVPFFLDGGAAWCTGRGEIVEPVPVARPLHFVLVAPPFGCPTAEVFRGLATESPSDGTRSVPAAAGVRDRGEKLRQALAQGDIDLIAQGLHNRLSASAIRLAPRLADYLDKLRSLGALGGLLTGSGSTVFALCAGRTEAKDLARAYARGPIDQNDKVFVVRSCASHLPP
jgi:4-diphosphocytidyl-2-C-methyl-D-erythritol kinase